MYHTTTLWEQALAVVRNSHHAVSMGTVPGSGKTTIKDTETGPGSGETTKLWEQGLAVVRPLSNENRA